MNYSYYLKSNIGENTYSNISPVSTGEEGSGTRIFENLFWLAKVRDIKIRIHSLVKKLSKSELWKPETEGNRLKKENLKLIILWHWPKIGKYFFAIWDQWVYISCPLHSYGFVNQTKSTELWLWPKMGNYFLCKLRSMGLLYISCPLHSYVFVNHMKNI